MKRGVEIFMQENTDKMPTDAVYVERYAAVYALLSYSNCRNADPLGCFSSLPDSSAPASSKREQWSWFEET